MKTQRIGYKMKMAIAYVRDNPGCTIIQVARHISPCPSPEGNWGYGYNPVHRAIDAGLISATTNGRGWYRLDVPSVGVEGIDS